MTEQEKRELAIARMIKDSEPHETDVTIEQYIDIVRRGGFQSFVRAYDAGYRKEEEVQKETAKRIEVELLKAYRRALLKTKGWKDWFKQEFGVVVSDEELFS